MKIAVLLAGCGVFDGSEIHEATLTLLALDQAGIHYQCIAPGDSQYKTVNHLDSSDKSEERNILEESARIARGDIKEANLIQASDYDALIIPGGFGAALNLCTFAISGSDCEVNAEVDALIKGFHSSKKPIGAMCIAPALLAKVLGSKNVALTIGTDEATAEAINSCGAQHKTAQVDEIIVDEVNLVVTTPAYMLASGPAQAWSGIEKLVEKIITLA